MHFVHFCRVLNISTPSGSSLDKGQPAAFRPNSAVISAEAKIMIPITEPVMNKPRYMAFFSEAQDSFCVAEV
jgi:hypothetical protein